MITGRRGATGPASHSAASIAVRRPLESPPNESPRRFPWNPTTRGAARPRDVGPVDRDAAPGVGIVTGGADVGRYDAVLIDLDGTLVDTLSEMTAAANAMLADDGRPTVGPQAIAEAVGEGAATLVGRLVGDADATRLLPSYLAHYATVNGTGATLYPGVVDGLDAMRAAGLAIACVTNKPRALVRPLLERLAIADRFDCIVGGGDTARGKPDPEPLLFAATRLGVDASRCVMIGDSKNDALAARAAGMRSWTVPYGYPGSRGDDDRAPALLARGITDAIVADLAEAGGWIVDAGREKIVRTGTGAAPATRSSDREDRPP